MRWAVSVAQCLGHEDDVDAPRGLVVDDERLGEEASGVAGALHSSELSRQAVLAYPAEAFVQVSDEFLVSDDEDHVSSGVGVSAELAAPEPTTIWPSSVMACALPMM